MTITIELENPMSCKGCPIMYRDNMNRPECKLNYNIIDEYQLIRPQQCIRENGE